MRRVILISLIISLFATFVVAQKQTTIYGDSWKGTIESANEAARQITITHLDKNKTETLVGVFEEGFKVKLIDGRSVELSFTELKPGVRIRVFYKSKTQDVAGQKIKVNVINRIQFVGRDDYTQLRELLNLEPTIAVSIVETAKLPAKDPFSLHLALRPPQLSEAIVLWADQWNKEQSAKYGRVEIVDELAQSDASLVVIWGEDDSYWQPTVQAGYKGQGPFNMAFGTAYLASKDDNGVHVLWQERIGVDVKDPRTAAPGLGKEIEKRLKARSK